MDHSAGVGFWVVNALCATVGASLAHYVDTTLGFGLTNTTGLFLLALAVTSLAQIRLRRHVPAAYWFMVVLAGVTGTLLAETLTAAHGLPASITATIFATLLVGVFGVWYGCERTLSLHGIVTSSREAFYWLAVLISFALGTALGDWVLEATGWTLGASVLLPAALILAVVAAWRLGTDPVLCFWLICVLTRPLGANLGDWFGSSSIDGGLGLGTLGTSLLFLVATLLAVGYLSVTARELPETEDRPTTVGY